MLWILTGKVGPDISSSIRWMFLVLIQKYQRAPPDCFCVFVFLSCCSADKAVTRSLKQTLPRTSDDSGSGRSEAEPLGQFNRKIRKRGIIDGAHLVFDPDMSYLSVWMRPADVSMYNNTVIRIPEAAGRLPLTFSSAKT